MSLHPTPHRARARRIFAPSTVAVAAALALSAGGAQAIEIATGNPDLTVRWDNSVRLNLATRVEARDDKIGNSALSDEGTYSFDKGDMVAKRFDLLSEFDVIYKKRFGARVSATAWYDGAYSGASRSNPNAPLTNIPSYIGKQYSATPSACTAAAPARSWTPSSSAASISATSRCRPSSAATPCTGASRCSSAATCTASPTRRTRSICRRASRHRAPRPRSCSGR